MYIQDANIRIIESSITPLQGEYLTVTLIIIITNTIVIIIS